MIEDSEILTDLLNKYEHMQNKKNVNHENVEYKLEVIKRRNFSVPNIALFIDMEKKYRDIERKRL